MITVRDCKCTQSNLCNKIISSEIGVKYVIHFVNDCYYLYQIGDSDTVCIKYSNVLERLFDTFIKTTLLSLKYKGEPVFSCDTRLKIGDKLTSCGEEYKIIDGWVQGQPNNRTKYLLNLKRLTINSFTPRELETLESLNQAAGSKFSLISE